MDLIYLVVVCCAIGFVVWALTTYIKMPDGWARAIQVLGLIVLFLFLLSRLVDIPNVLTR